MLCRDAFERYPESIVGNAGGHECMTEVPGVGWQCPVHQDMTSRLWSTPVADVPDEREAKAAKAEAAQPVDPEVVARIAEARAYLDSCAQRLKAEDDFTVGSVPSFCRDLIADPKYGTKWFRITERMADALIRTRDAEQARKASVAVDQPRAAEAIEWVHDNAPTNDFAGSLLAALRKWGRLTDRQYEAVLRNLDRPGRPAASQAPVAEGFYKAGEAIFKVQRSRQSGRLYAKRLVVTDHGQATWEYAAGAMASLSEDDRLSVEQAAEFGHRFGVCAICGATLTDPKSIEQGVGPICITRLA